MYRIKFEDGDEWFYEADAPHFAVLEATAWWLRTHTPKLPVFTVEEVISED